MGNPHDKDSLVLEGNVTILLYSIWFFILIDFASQIFVAYLYWTVKKDDDFQVLLFAFIVSLAIFILSVAPTKFTRLIGFRISSLFVIYRVVAAIQSLILCLRLGFSVTSITWLIFQQAYLIHVVYISLVLLKLHRKRFRPKATTGGERV